MNDTNFDIKPRSMTMEEVMRMKSKGALVSDCIALAHHAKEADAYIRFLGARLVAYRLALIVVIVVLSGMTLLEWSYR